MALIVDREEQGYILSKTRRRMQKKMERQESESLDIVSWNERNFYLPDTGKPIIYEPFQKAVLLYAFPPHQEGFRFSLVVFSSIKKSGKTTLAAGVGRWVAEERTRFGWVGTMGNDARQAKERSFGHMSNSIKMSPGYRNRGIDGLLPERWLVQSTKMECLSSGTTVEAVAVDARGEAGGNPDLTIWTELWGFEHPDAIKFWEEMTPVPTKPSCRLVETYAGFDGESQLLRNIYNTAMEEGRQLTAGELAEETGVPLGAFAESSASEDLVPIWVNESLGFFCYWDTGEVARRMEWQQGEMGAQYYAEQESNLAPPTFLRIHHNLWVGGEGDFIPMTAWDACKEELPAFDPGDKTPAILSVDAATTGDCFGITLVTRHPQRHEDVAIRRVRKWDPPKGGRINYEEPEEFIRLLVLGGCRMGHSRDRKRDGSIQTWNVVGEKCPACKEDPLPPYNIVQICYDPYQLESMMQKFNKEGLTWCDPFNQGGDRMKADSMFYDLIMNRRLAHTGQSELREHIQNAGSKQSKDEDTKLRIVKKDSARKIDLAVAASMACYRCLYLLL